MGATTAIEWCDKTFNPWRGCTKVSPGCQHCYAETLSKRNPSVLGEWGPDGRRAVAAESYWRLPLAWNAEARTNGVRRRVFCASLADVFEDRDELRPHRLRLLALTAVTPNLDWLFLTKRPQNVLRLLGTAANDAAEAGHGVAEVLQGWLDNDPPANVWLGASVEDQQRAEERLPALLRIPAVIRFLSCEPLLGPVDLEATVLHEGCDHMGADCVARHRLHWVIVGGESGPHARVMQPDWPRTLLAQCQMAGIPFFFKQWGEWQFRAEPADDKMIVGFYRIGKKQAGRLLMGREWNEFPEVR